MSALQIILALAPYIEKYGPAASTLIFAIYEAIEKAQMPAEVQAHILETVKSVGDKTVAATAIAVLKDHVAGGDHADGVLPNWTLHK